MACPTFENIVDFADGRLAPEEASRVAHHTNECSECAETSRWYEGAVMSAALDTSVEPPAWVTRRAVELFTDARSAAERRGVRGLLARLRAALVFDSLAGETVDAIPARRSAGVETRQLLFSASPYDVDMLISSREPGDGLSVTGQVLGGGEGGFGDVAGLEVELRSEGREITTATTSEFGEFTFEGVAPGTYEITLASERREIVLADAPIRLK